MVKSIVSIRLCFLVDRAYFCKATKEIIVPVFFFSVDCMFEFGLQVNILIFDRIYLSLHLCDVRLVFLNLVLKLDSDLLLVL